MSHPALEVTGSQDVGSSHSQLSVPLAPAVVGGVGGARGGRAVLLPHAATAEIVTIAAAAAATR